MSRIPGGKRGTLFLLQSPTGGGIWLSMVASVQAVLRKRLLPTASTEALRATSNQAAGSTVARLHLKPAARQVPNP